MGTSITQGRAAKEKKPDANATQCSVEEHLHLPTTLTVHPKNKWALPSPLRSAPNRVNKAASKMEGGGAAGVRHKVFKSVFMARHGGTRL